MTNCTRTNEFIYGIGISIYPFPFWLKLELSPGSIIFDSIHLMKHIQVLCHLFDCHFHWIKRFEFRKLTCFCFFAIIFKGSELLLFLWRWTVDHRANLRTAMTTTKRYFPWIMDRNNIQTKNHKLFHFFFCLNEMAGVRLFSICVATWAFHSNAQILEKNNHFSHYCWQSNEIVCFNAGIWLASPFFWLIACFRNRLLIVHLHPFIGFDSILSFLLLFCIVFLFANILW